MTTAPLQFRSADLLPGAAKPWVRPRWLRLLALGLAADAVFAACALGTAAVRTIL